MHASKVTAVVAALGLVIVGSLGYGAYLAVQKRAEQRAVVSVVAETTTQLRDVLTKTPPAGLAGRIEGNLQAARSWRNKYMGDAAEIYLISAREIAGKRADAGRHAREFAASRAALAAHMSAAGARDSTWIRTASRLKKQVESDHFALETSLHALAELLYTLPDAQKRLEPYVEASLVLEDALRVKAREQAMAEAQRASRELEKVRSLAPRY